ncbi:MAG: hypothetical protein PHW33_02275 [Candidatus Portnoybacteria bacterium]|nr:hypothetical protein [Candidatus Portnoybacteria bacterium]
MSKKGEGVPEQDLIKEFNLESNWYATTFREGGLVSSRYNAGNNEHIVTLSAKGFSALSGLKHWYEKPIGLISIGIIILIIGSVLYKIVIFLYKLILDK